MTEPFQLESSTGPQTIRANIFGMVSTHHLVVRSLLKKTEPFQIKLLLPPCLGESYMWHPLIRALKQGNGKNNRSKPPTFLEILGSPN